MDKWNNNAAKQRGPELGGHSRNEYRRLGLRESVEMVLTEVQLGGQAPVPEFLGLNASSGSHRPRTSHVTSLYLSCLLWKMGITLIQK